MKILVLVKAVPDTAAQIVATADGSGVTLEGIELQLNPYDEFAVEQALQVGGEITVAAVGDERMEKALRQALALGVQAAVRIDAPAAPSALAIAHLLHAYAADKGFEIIFAGKQAVDEDRAQIPQLLAERLGWPHVTAVSRFEESGGEATTAKRFEFGEVTQTTRLPAVFSCEKGLNEPRFPSLQGRLKAKKKPLEILDAAALGVAEADLASGLRIESYENLPQKTGGSILTGNADETAAELVKLLREQAKVI